MKPKANAGLRETIRKIANSVLKEDGPDAMRVDWSIMADQLDEAVSDETMMAAEEVTINVREHIMIAAAKIINQHNMVDTTHGRVDPRSFEQLLRDFDDDGVATLTAECAADVDEALRKFAHAVGQLAVHVTSARDR